jgi:hypothetical protein
MGFNWNARYKLANKVTGTVKARYQYVARSLRHRRLRFTTRVSDIDFTVMALFWFPLPKFLVGPEKQSFSRDRWLVVVTVVV